ncbi:MULTISPECIES: ABC transporter permease [Xanthomonas]|uniref:FtsX-like permease family protein n=1 Tax=Xanthomonas rydalmerensis TaxID=3046274 RepID=A0ABZ0JMU1_9XANT|nr:MULTISPECIES: FtsX-like permease family protein [unclassified Xanthomonas]MBB5878727.1 putative ABC transport system permease protein [Xanthomonas sp. 3498]WOS40350.1 FtsX-like permease family protein [Xanthomonas sp. DM-2023]WOS44534.1 FtsX-like permease family protein [Xanthomonas sp. DM-2023]WOS48714.1 FtsX-like permease family protein [Xanthomonas sp. DM-2023]WOS52894.1 FtsX-like permease family protein [Xanthomonas sp. DM-2023]
MTALPPVRPILSALGSHRAAVVLMALQIALTLAVLCNLVFIIARTYQRVQTPTGVMEQDIGLIQSIGVVGEPGSISSVGRSLDILQAVPGVEAAAFGAPPLWGPAQAQLFLEPQATQPAARATLFTGSQGLNRTLGIRIVAGRDLRDTELPGASALFGAPAEIERRLPALITPSLAAKLFPGASPLGRSLYTSVFSQSVRLDIVGVMAPVRGEITGHDDDADALLTELRVGSEGWGGGYLIRSAPGQLAQALPRAAAAMQRANPTYVQQQVATMQELRADYFKSDNAVARMLLAIILILLTVTALGIGGLASFWVQQRTRQIGIRRALGATRGDILRYFQLENLLIVGGGALLGAVLAYVMNQWLMQRFELERLSSPTVLTGILAVWLLGQLAVLGPALRAAAVPPATATRSA